MTTRNSLDSLFRPKSIAVIGASGTPTKIGGVPIAHLKRYGYRGPIYPINPQYETHPGPARLQERQGRRQGDRSRDRRGAGRHRAEGAQRSRRSEGEVGRAVHVRLCRDRRSRRKGAAGDRRAVAQERHAHPRTELPRRDERRERGLRDLQPGRGHRHRQGRQHRSRQPVRRIRRLCLFAGARARPRPQPLGDHRQRIRHRAGRLPRLAGGRRRDKGHPRLHGRLPRRRKAAPRARQGACGEKADRDRQGRPHRARRRGGGLAHGGAGGRRCDLRCGVQAVWRLARRHDRRGVRRRLRGVGRGRRARQVDRHADRVRRCRRHDGGRGGKPRSGRQAAAGSGAEANPRARVVCVGGQSGRRHRPDQPAIRK